MQQRHVLRPDARRLAALDLEVELVGRDAGHPSGTGPIQHEAVERNEWIGHKLRQPDMEVEDGPGSFNASHQAIIAWFAGACSSHAACASGSGVRPATSNTR